MYAINFLDLDQIYLIRRTLGTFILNYIWYFGTAPLRFLSLFNFAIYRFYHLTLFRLSFPSSIPFYPLGFSTNSHLTSKNWVSKPWWRCNCNTDICLYQQKLGEITQHQLHCLNQLDLYRGVEIPEPEEHSDLRQRLFQSGNPEVASNDSIINFLAVCFFLLLVISMTGFIAMS